MADKLKETERKKEGWVEFIRYYCREGFIDYYTGDVSHNPNNDRRPRYKLNTIRGWIRLDGKGKWVEPLYHGGLFDEEMRAAYSALEIFTTITEHD